MDYNSPGNVTAAGSGLASGFTLGGVRVTTTMAGPTQPLAPNGTINNSAFMDNSSTKTSNIGGSQNRSLVFNVKGSDTTTLTMTFQPPVKDLVLHFKDVSFGLQKVNNTTYSARDTFTFTKPSAGTYTFTDKSGPDGSSGPTADQRKLDPASTGILRRTSTNANNYPDHSDQWFDADVAFSGTVDTVQVTFSNGDTPAGSYTKGYAAAAIWGMAFCA